MKAEFEFFSFSKRKKSYFKISVKINPTAKVVVWVEGEFPIKSNCLSI